MTLNAAEKMKGIHALIGNPAVPEGRSPEGVGEAQMG